MRDSYVHTECPVRHTKCGRMRGMIVGEGGRSSGVLLYYRRLYSAQQSKTSFMLVSIIIIIHNVIHIKVFLYTAFD